jgi:hypothetical protein
MQISIQYQFAGRVRLGLWPELGKPPSNRVVSASWKVVSAQAVTEVIRK